MVVECCLKQNTGVKWIRDYAIFLRNGNSISLEQEGVCGVSLRNSDVGPGCQRSRCAYQRRFAVTNDRIPCERYSIAEQSAARRHQQDPHLVHVSIRGLSTASESGLSSEHVHTSDLPPPIAGIHRSLDWDVCGNSYGPSNSRCKRMRLRTCLATKTTVFSCCCPYCFGSSTTTISPFLQPLVSTASQYPNIRIHTGCFSSAVDHPYTDYIILCITCTGADRADVGLWPLLVKAILVLDIPLHPYGNTLSSVKEKHSRTHVTPPFYLSNIWPDGLHTEKT